MQKFRRVTLVLGLLLATSLSVPQSYAQNQTDPELPDIAPREVEITGQLEISFPTLQRQPLIGFNPPPRLPEISADRVPFVEEYKQESVDLPPSPLAPPNPPGLAGLDTYPPASLELDATVGRYFSRTVRGRAGVPLGSSEALLASLDYRGLDSYAPFQDEAPYNLFDGGLGITSSRASLTAGAEINGFVDSYSLFGARIAGGAFPVLTQPTRDASGLRTAAWLRTTAARGPDLRLRAGYESAILETDIFDTHVEEGPNHRTSQRLLLDGSAEFPLGKSRLMADAGLGRATLDEFTAANTSYLLVNAGAAYRVLLGRTMQLTAGARLLAYQLEATDAAIALAETRRERELVSPDLRLELFLAHGAMLYAHNRPGAEENDLISVYQHNPFVVSEPFLAPTIRPIEAEAGGRFFLGPVQVGVRGGYRDYANYLYFEHADATETQGYERGFSALRYGEATVAYGGGDLSVSVARGLQATVGLAVRRGRLEDDVEIPYFGPILAEAMISYSFDKSRGLVQLTAEYESSRYRDRIQSRQIGDFFDLDLHASYQIADAFRILVAVDNMSADFLERYDGYQLPSFVARAGIGMRW